MEIPTDFTHPFYGHLRNDILSMLTGPLAGQNESEESALRKVRQHSGAERGYSDAYVKSLPEWQARFGQPDLAQAVAKAEETAREASDEAMTPVPFQDEAKEKTPQTQGQAKK